MRLWAFGSLCWYAHRDIGRLEAMRELLGEPVNAHEYLRQRYTTAAANAAAEEQAENAQAARECASADREDDPQPGAFYGLPDTDPDPEPS